MAKMNVVLNSTLDAKTLNEMVNSGGAPESAIGLRRVLAGMMSGAQDGQFIYSVNGISATGSVSFSGTGTAGDTVTVNGQALTAVTGVAGNNQWVVAASASGSAINLAATIAASTSETVKLVSAVAAGTVVTLTAKEPGVVGNLMTLAESGTGTTVSGAVLAGGAGTTVTRKFGVA